MKRRQFLKLSAIAGAGILISGKPAWSFALSEAFTLPTLPYSYDALLPIIDAKTMEIHHSKHHQAYVDNLNKAIKTASPSFQNTNLKGLMALTDSNTPVAIRNNGGGHYNHSLFWTLLQPVSKENQPEGTLKSALIAQFGSLEAFQQAFEEVAMKVFGSGWVWLIKTKEGNLAVGSTPNQDNPLMQVSALKGTPVLALDVWEHAYYLLYQNKRKEYVQNFWKIVNWDTASRLYREG